MSDWNGGEPTDRHDTVQTFPLSFGARFFAGARDGAVQSCCLWGAVRP
jgi:hypothetical protein